VLSWCAVLGFGGTTAADEPSCGAEDVGVAEDGVVAVNSNQGNVDDLALPDRDHLDPRAVSTADGVAEGDHIVHVSDLLGTGPSRKHAHGLFAHGIEVGEAVGVGEVIVGRLASDGPDFLTELGLNVRVLCKGPYSEAKCRGCRLVAGHTMKQTTIKIVQQMQQQQMATYTNVTI